jgi:hypothetical protein
MSAGSLPRPPDTRLTEAAFIAGTFVNEAHLECARNIALRAVFALLLDLRTHDYSAVELRGGARLLEMGDPDGMALLSGVVSLQMGRVCVRYYEGEEPLRIAERLAQIAQQALQHRARPVDLVALATDLKVVIDFAVAEALQRSSATLTSTESCA